MAGPRDAVELFSESYLEARERFYAASAAAGFELEAMVLEGLL